MKSHKLYEYLKEYFIYNDDGTFTRKDRKNSNGSYDKDGYLIIKIKGKQYKAHRLVWLFHHGKFPKHNIDHINRIRDDNRIENLRDVNQQVNVQNTTRKPNKITGVVGIYYDKTPGLKKHYAFHFKGKTYRFKKLEDAIKEREDLYENSRNSWETIYRGQ